MYVIRDGPVHRHAQQFPRGSMPGPVFICCGSIGVILTIIGGIVLGVGQRKSKKETQDYTYTLIGSVVLGVGFILTVLAVFLSVSWTSLRTTSSDHQYEPATRRTSRSSSVAVTRDLVLDDMELNGYRASSHRPSSA